ncbi:MAG: hypothetical protein SOV62_00345 [Alloprevotella sp.]|nr:hypothetical protein [Alloprevotella sp.]
MKPHIKRITVVWRLGRGTRRIPVASIKCNAVGATFEYNKEELQKAKEQGFMGFPDFPDTQMIHTVNVLKALSLRINDKDRSDIQSYYDFWEVPREAFGDTYRMLAYTQGILPTDNFEFLAEYYGVKGVRFVSEIASLSINQLENDTLKVGDVLQWEKEPDNAQDKKAIVLLKDGQKIGYVKRIHNYVFHLKHSRILQVKVKKIEHNGHITRAFISIYNPID